MYIDVTFDAHHNPDGPDGQISFLIVYLEVLNTDKKKIYLHMS